VCIVTLLSWLWYNLSLLCYFNLLLNKCKYIFVYVSRPIIVANCLGYMFFEPLSILWYSTSTFECIDFRVFVGYHGWARWLSRRQIVVDSEHGCKWLRFEIIPWTRYVIDHTQSHRQTERLSEWMNKYSLTSNLTHDRSFGKLVFPGNRLRWYWQETDREVGMFPSCFWI